MDFEGVLQPVGQCGNVRSANKDDIVLDTGRWLDIRIGVGDGHEIVDIHYRANPDSETMIYTLRRDMVFPLRDRDVVAAAIGSDAAASGRCAVRHEVDNALLGRRSRTRAKRSDL